MTNPTPTEEARPEQKIFDKHRSYTAQWFGPMITAGQALLFSENTPNYITLTRKAQLDARLELAGIYAAAGEADQASQMLQSIQDEIRAETVLNMGVAALGNDGIATAVREGPGKLRRAMIEKGVNLYEDHMRPYAAGADAKIRELTSRRDSQRRLQLEQSLTERI